MYPGSLTSKIIENCCQQLWGYVLFHRTKYDHRTHKIACINLAGVQFNNMSVCRVFSKLKQFLGLGGAASRQFTGPGTGTGTGFTGTGGQFVGGQQAFVAAPAATGGGGCE